VTAQPTAIPLEHRPVLSWSSAMGFSLLAALGRPTWWLFAMAAFLLRGGFLILLLPIVSLPTAAGLTNVIAPTVVGVVFGGPSSLPGLLAGAALVGAVWLLGGGFIAAVIDVALVEDVASDDELDAPVAARPGLALRVLAVRLLAHVPTVVVLVWAGARLALATYEELAAPGEAAIPIVLRIAARAPEAVVAMLVIWAIGEAVGGLAARGLIRGSGVVHATLEAWLALIRRGSTVPTLLITNAALFAVVIASVAVASVAWNGLRLILVDGGSRPELVLGLVTFSVSWLAGAWLIAIAAAWRQAAWTFEALRSRRN
jgi:hypothetical protein